MSERNLRCSDKVTDQHAAPQSSRSLGEEGNEPSPNTRRPRDPCLAVASLVGRPDFDRTSNSPAQDTKTAMAHQSYSTPIPHFKSATATTPPKCYKDAEFAGMGGQFDELSAYPASLNQGSGATGLDIANESAFKSTESPFYHSGAPYFAGTQPVPSRTSYYTYPRHQQPESTSRDINSTLLYTMPRTASTNRPPSNSSGGSELMQTYRSDASDTLNYSLYHTTQTRRDPQRH